MTELAQRAGVVLSVKPRFADAILSGAKDVEVRRQPVGVQPGDIVLLYSSTPEKAVTGWATVADFLVEQADALWRSHGHRTQLRRAEYDSYFAGVDLAYGLVLTDPHRMANPVPLADLREIHGVHPPQSWRYLPRSLHPGEDRSRRRR